MDEVQQAAAADHGGVPVRSTDVFVSYSRVDRDFVVALTTALTARGKHAWVDLEDIPPSAEWMAEIVRAIESADAYLVVVSPDSACSKVCGEELEHAKEAGKRIIPVVARATDPDAVPPSLAALNWVDATGGPTPDVIDRVIQAAETDLEHVRAHTRLLTRASDWVARGEPGSLLLRGDDLKEAETLLVAGQGKDPGPTPVQARFVQVSRQRATRRQRAVVAIAVCVALVASALGVFAWDQRNVAVEKSRVARSRELAATAVSQLKVDPETSLILSLLALRTDDTSQAEDALRLSLIGSHETGIIRDSVGPISSGGGIEDAEYSPDGKLIVSADADGVARVWNATTGQLVTSLSGDTRLDANAVFSPSGRQVATSSNDKTARIWSASTGRLLHVLHLPGPGWTVRYDPQGRRLVTPSQKEVIIWDAHTGRKIADFHSSHSLTSAEFSPDGTRVLVSAKHGAVDILDARTGRVVQHLTNGTGSSWNARFSPDGALVAATEGTSIDVWDARTGRQLVTLSGTDEVFGLAFSPNSAYIATSDASGAIRLWDTGTGTLLAELYGHTAEAYQVDFSPGGSTLLSSSWDGTIRTWALSPGVPSLRFGVGNAAFGAAVSPDGQLLATAYQGGVKVVDARNGAVEQVIAVDRRAEAVSFRPDGLRLAVAASHGESAVYDTRTWKRLFPLRYPGAFYDIAYSPDGRYIATGGHDGVVRLYDGTTGRRIGQMTGHKGPIYKIGFSPDGTELVSAGLDGTARVWAIPSGKLVSAIHAGLVKGENGGQLYWAAFTPDGDQVAVARQDGSLTFWDPATGKLLRSMSGGPINAYGVGIRSDGRYAALAGVDGHLRFLDLSSGRIVEEITTGAAALTTATWLPDGDVFATTYTDGFAGVYACDVCSSLQQQESLAHQRVFRSLTPAERKRFL